MYSEVMPTATLVPVEEYLSTSYRPDREYLDGVLLERNVGEHDHGRLQCLLISYLGTREKQWGIHVVPGQRVQVKPRRYRVPDVCALAHGVHPTPIFAQPPFLCVEILSKDDRMSEMRERIDDYLSLGMAYVWLIDPRTRRAWIYTAAGIREAADAILRTENPDISVPLGEIFE